MYILVCKAGIVVTKWAMDRRIRNHLPKSWTPKSPLIPSSLSLSYVTLMAYLYTYYLDTNTLKQYPPATIAHYPFLSILTAHTG